MNNIYNIIIKFEHTVHIPYMYKQESVNRIYTPIV